MICLTLFHFLLLLGWRRKKRGWKKKDLKRKRAGGHAQDLFCVQSKEQKKNGRSCRGNSEASETAVHGVRKWSGKTGLEIIITGPSADLGLCRPRAPSAGHSVWSAAQPEPQESWPPRSGLLTPPHAPVLWPCEPVTVRALSLSLYLAAAAAVV